MNRARILAIVLAATMLLPLVPLPAATAAQEPVSFRPQVTYTDVRSETQLYVQKLFDPLGAAPETDVLWTYPPTKDDAPREEAYAVAAGLTETANIHRAQIDMRGPLRHAVTVTGQNAFSVDLYVKAPPNLQFTVTVQDVRGDERVPVATGTFTSGPTAAADANGVQRLRGVLTTTKDPETDTYRYTFDSSPNVPRRIGLAVSASATPADGATAGTWTLVYGSELYPTRLGVVAENALKTAAWTEDEDRKVTNVFRVDTGANAKNWIRAYFVMKSAFGWDDFEDYPGTGYAVDEESAFRQPREPTPRAELLYQGESISFNDVSGALPVVNLRRDSEFSSDPEGTVTYTFEPGFDHIDYTKLEAKPPGSYEIRFTSAFRPDDSLRQAPSTLSTKATFSIANAGVALVPYPGDPGESTSHRVAAGHSTTYVLLAQNLGDVYDNLTLELLPLPSQQPGWSALLGGPAVKSGNRVELPPKSSGIVTVTIQTPSGAGAGAAATYQLRGTSQLDPTQRTDPVPLLTTIVPAAETQPGAGILVPEGENLVRTGQSVTTPVYLWNRGSRPTDLTMAIELPASADADRAQGWTNVSLVYAGVPSQQVSVEEVAPGAIVQVDLRASAIQASEVADPYTVHVNATYAGLDDPPVAQVVFKPDLTAGFTLRMLSGFGGATKHWVEMHRATTENDPRSRGSDKDGLGGTWYRLWITNIGAEEDQYDVKVDFARENINDDNFTAQQIATGRRFLAWGENADPSVCGQGCLPQVGYRTQEGVFDPIDSGELVTVPAGRTAELYVWVAHEIDHDQFPLSDYRFTVRVSSTDAGSQVVSGEAVANDACTASQPKPDTDGQGEIYACNSFGYQALPGIESVTRDPNYDTNHLVDISNFEKRTVAGSIPLNGPGAIYKVRLTNAASFGSFTTANGLLVPSNLNVTLLHDDESGWRAVMRFVGQGKEGERNDPLKDYGGDWNTSLELYNKRPPADSTDKWKPFAPPESPATSQSFYDREIEILVQPPANRRVFAGESHDVRLQANIRHPVLGSQSDGLVIKTVIAQRPQIEVQTPLDLGDVKTVYATPGGQGIFGVFVLNNGSSPTTVKVRTDSQGGGADGSVWTATPSETSFNLTPKENRTIALRVTAPTNAAVGTQNTFQVKVSWPQRQDDPNGPEFAKFLNFTAETIQNEAITVTPQPQVINAEPRQNVNFTIRVVNTGQTKADYEIDTILVPNWSATLAPRVLRDVQPNGGEAFASFVMKVPGDVISGSSHQFVVRVRESATTLQDPSRPNVDYAVATLNIVGGRPIPSLQVGDAEQIIERAGKVQFNVSVRNLGNVPGTFPIALIGPGDIGWSANVTDEQGRSIESITIPANAMRKIQLHVFAPVDVPERRVQEIELQVLTSDRSTGDRATFRTVIHDYGLDIQALPERADLIPGLQATFNVRVRNLGNDNDTFNLTLDMGLLADLWNYEYGQLQVRVPPNEYRDVRLTVRSPKDNLPTPRTVQMYAYAGSQGAAKLEDFSFDAAQRFAKLDSTPLFLTVLDYRVGDVDGDNLLELAVDANRRKSDGFELFKEIYTTGVLSQAIESAQDVVTGHTRFLIDVPQSGSYDGLADVFWDPDAASVTRIQYTADVNFDASPDYFLDVNADTLVDRVYDSGGRRYLTVEAWDILGRGDLRKQYLVYTDADRFPDAFYDPEKNEVWKVIPTPSVGENVVGFIPKDKTKPTLYYDIAAQRVYQSPLVDSVEFFKEHWYVGLLFVGAVVVLGVGIARRRPFG